MKDKIASVLTVLFYVILSVSFVGGEVHSFKKHGAGDCVMGAIFFPWGIYRGAEALWHDDYSGIDWDKRLRNDMRMCYFFISEVNNKEISQLQFSDDLEKFSLRINKYPKEKRQYLMDGTRKCCQYTELMVKDVMSSMVNYYKSNAQVFSWSENTNQLEKDLIKLKLKDEVDVAKKGFEIALKQLEDNLQSNIAISLDSTKIKSIESACKIGSDQQNAGSKKIFKNLFNEEL